jgi:hypothetical protein
MAMAWLVTIPAAGAPAAAFYLLTDALGPEIAGPVAVSVLAAAAAAWLYIQTQRSGAIRAGDSDDRLGSPRPGGGLPP